MLVVEEASSSSHPLLVFSNDLNSEASQPGPDHINFITLSDRIAHQLPSPVFLATHGVMNRFFSFLWRLGFLSLSPIVCLELLL